MTRGNRKNKPTFEISPSAHRIPPGPRSRISHLRMLKMMLTQTGLAGGCRG